MHLSTEKDRFISIWKTKYSSIRLSDLSHILSSLVVSSCVGLGRTNEDGHISAKTLLVVLVGFVVLSTTRVDDACVNNVLVVVRINIRTPTHK